MPARILLACLEMTDRQYSTISVFYEAIRPFPNCGKKQSLLLCSQPLLFVLCVFGKVIWKKKGNNGGSSKSSQFSTNKIGNDMPKQDSKLAFCWWLVAGIVLILMSDACMWLAG
jgi:hypothetical protein